MDYESERQTRKKRIDPQLEKQAGESFPTTLLRH